MEGCQRKGRSRETLQPLRQVGSHYVRHRPSSCPEKWPRCVHEHLLFLHGIGRGNEATKATRRVLHVPLQAGSRQVLHFAGDGYEATCVSLPRAAANPVPSRFLFGVFCRAGKEDGEALLSCKDQAAKRLAPVEESVDGLHLLVHAPAKCTVDNHLGFLQGAESKGHISVHTSPHFLRSGHVPRRLPPYALARSAGT